eukprot:TRINITY_DN10411_c0_g1_i1.p1 TRINITY_DN10411_c0_g1~~TRINITY_DN10411_c0_g1_i1.p1  ORF type:complete len:412 (+),score=18.17 TRINITY_DN10411_c0_g1_i1:275-1510(+)
MIPVRVVQGAPMSMPSVVPTMQPVTVMPTGVGVHQPAGYIPAVLPAQTARGVHWASQIQQGAQQFPQTVPVMQVPAHPDQAVGPVYRSVHVAGGYGTAGAQLQHQPSAVQSGPTVPGALMVQALSTAPQGVDGSRPPRAAAAPCSSQESVAMGDQHLQDDDADQPPLLLGVGGGARLRPLRVSGSTPVPSLTDSAGVRLKHHGSVEIQGMGPEALSRAVHALATLSAHHTDIICQVQFVSFQAQQSGEARVHPGISFMVRSFPGYFPARAFQNVAAPANAAGPTHMRISRQSIVAKAAGAIAQQMRGAASRGRPVVLVPDPSHHAVNILVKALALSRIMICRDGLDLHFRVRFQTGSAGGSASRRNKDADCSSMLVWVGLQRAPERVHVDPDTERLSVGCAPPSFVNNYSY